MRRSGSATPSRQFVIVATAAALGFVSAPRSAAQSPGVEASKPRFEVASVKPAAHPNPGDWRITGGPGTSSPGQFTATGAPLQPLIGISYKLKPYQLIGPPSIKNYAYDIVAKVPAGATREQFLVMIQNLLTERFDLKFHREPREMSVHDLVVAKGGPKLREPEKPAAGSPPKDPQAPFPKDKDGAPILPPGIPNFLGFRENGNVRYVARMQPVNGSLLINLEQLAGRPVVDKTGLTGVYDFNLLFRAEPLRVPGPESANPAEPAMGGVDGEPAPDIFAALEQQLGLKLQSAKGSIEVFVVDSFNRTPAGN
jgi:uncharacterized protein (TIGR03435 family)